MHDLFRVQPPPLDPALAGALAHAAGAFARLDQALAGHPLLPAFLHRARLEAVRRQAAVDGQAIDPWHLAAVLEGLRLRMDGALRIIDRGAILAAARHALDLHQWLTAPDFDQEGDVQRAEQVLAAAAASGATPLLAAATGLHAWLGVATATAVAAPARRSAPPWCGSGDPAPPAAGAGATDRRPRAAPRHALAARRLGAGVPELRWLTRRTTGSAVAARNGARLARRPPRRGRPPAAIPAPPPRWISSPRRRSLSATSLAAGLGMAVKNATQLLDDFCAAGIAIEVTHRSKRRLFGLTGLAPLRDVVRPPYRPEPGRGRGRPRLKPAADARWHRAALAPVTPFDRRPFDYSDLAHWMTQMDQTIRHARRTLGALMSPVRLPPEPDE